ncbi:hypothetical protein PENSTE_c006G01161 [Penicillium steckii]|uniref:NAD dependent epimerase/dehydratase n=1 Tax=Penicillium steckii TaxID=303698 RepID=A0A1V6TG11_9EURO|nr:hypothetical protein PENSTE_c006G01161 [Penicillium steckii]
MGQKVSSPQPGAGIQVIGAGLPRTGTSSFNAALEVLLEGPSYHGGSQISKGRPEDIRSWIKILQYWNKGDPKDQETMKQLIRERLDGYIGVTDAPCAELVPELLEIYPNAKVICTIRDPEAWAKSLAQIRSLALMWFLRAVLLPLPGMRHFPAYVDQLSIQWKKLYNDGPQDHGVATYNRHIAWLKKNVPEDRLFFVDVKDGWGPVCKALGKEPPKDVPFPRFNDSEAIQETSKYHIQRGLIRWAAIIVTISVPGLAYYLKNRLQL